MKTFKERSNMTSDSLFALFRRRVPENHQQAPGAVESERDVVGAAHGNADPKDRDAVEPETKVVPIPEEIFIECGNQRLSLIGICK